MTWSVGGPFGLAAGEWTDDTSVALCLADNGGRNCRHRGATIVPQLVAQLQPCGRLEGWPGNREYSRPILPLVHPEKQT